jgi:ubiquinone/menaquinone biosynthesis C-methylase UbiE
MTAAAPFDAIAERYDELWTNTAAGRLQREAVWREIDPLFAPGARVLDLGCGTGEDALHMMQAGVMVSAVDASTEMVRVARARGVGAEVLEIEEIGALNGTWDGVLSNFGALNCVRDIEALRDPLAQVVRPGGCMALCVMGRFCMGETLRFLSGGQFRKAVRRWSGKSESRSLGLCVYYPTVRRIRRAFEPEFTLLRTVGIGMADHRLLIFVRTTVSERP